jgi:hypothetical protein
MIQWIQSLPEPWSTIVATIIAVFGVISIFGGPALIVMIGIRNMVMSETDDESK